MEVDHMANITRPKGTADIYGANAAMWRYIEGEIYKTADLFALEEMRTPMFENVELFVRSVGEATDIVQKEMYTFTDRGERVFALKPEGTAPAVRAYLENSLHNMPMPVKMFYIAHIFRAERPQKGRYRQHHQFGVEFFGSNSAASDAELISVGYYFLTKFGLANFDLHINSIGSSDDRKRYNTILLDFLRGHIDGLCELCKSRMEKNPMRVLDCKNPNCSAIVANAPVPLDHISPEAMGHFEALQAHLRDLDIPFIINKGLVRGLDYYTHTVFEIIPTDNTGSQATILGGGRYDGLIGSHGGSPTGAVGFGMGIERLMILMEEQGKLPVIKTNIDIFVGSMGEKGAAKARQLVYDLRKAGVSAISDLCDRSVKAQLKYADKLEAAFSLVLGETELESGRVLVKNMQNGETAEIEIDKIVEHFRRTT